MSEEEFETNKNALITRRLEKPKQLLGYSRKLWEEIDIMNYFFNRDEEEVEVIKKLTKEDVRGFFEVNSVVFNSIFC